MVAAIGLSACGGGDDGGSGSSGSSGSSAASNGTSSTGAPSGSASSSSTIRVEGQSQSISSQVSTVRILMPPASWNGGQMPNGNYTLRALTQPTATLKEQAPGAYVAIPYDSSGTIKTLTKGIVTDLAGNGAIALGRWADGADSSGAAYNANQGASMGNRCAGCDRHDLACANAMLAGLRNASDVGGRQYGPGFAEWRRGDADDRYRYLW
ncbi:hypothetical protein EMIT0111MI5_200003 [Burkholderia sp. IT-111MI5]